MPTAEFTLYVPRGSYPAARSSHYRADVEEAVAHASRSWAKKPIQPILRFS
jgi:hypothetical protein